VALRAKQHIVDHAIHVLLIINNIKAGRRCQAASNTQYRDAMCWQRRGNNFFITRLKVSLSQLTYYMFTMLVWLCCLIGLSMQRQLIISSGAYALDL